MMKSTIAVSKETKEKLDKLKVHPREPYEDVIKRLIEKCVESSLTSYENAGMG